MDDDDEGDFMPPPNTVTFAIPNEPELHVAYDLYRPSPETRRLYSERNREVYSEAFIEHEHLGTLADLCVRALAKLGLRSLPEVVRNDPMKMRIFYDAMDVNMPLQDCYFVEDQRFWRRVVLAKSSNKCLSLKKVDEYDWKGKGVSLKYVELVEACPALYWPQTKMANLADMVRQYVRTLHLRHLQSLPDDSFRHYVESEEELDVSSESHYSEISSDESDTMESEEEEAEEEAEPEPEPLRQKKKVVGDKFTVEVLNAEEVDKPPKKKVSLTELDLKRRQARAARNAARQQLRDMLAEKKAERLRRKVRRQQMMQKPPPEPKKKKKKKKEKKGADVKPTIDDVFNMEVPPEPEDDEAQKADLRNKDKLLRRIKRYDYPAKHCHHIDLSFVRWFDMLVSLTVEFLGPEMERGYHYRHLNFSYDDMVHLATGLRNLHQLKVFRLRNSRMDHIKLLILSRSLKALENLEVVDFGFDQLNDQCSVALEMLLDRKNMLKALELEYNRLERTALVSIGEALKYYSIQNPEGSPLEYLGLAHNPVSETGLNLLVTLIQGTNHIQELNINSIETPASRLTSIISLFLRRHEPLRRLDMAGLKLNPIMGRQLICALETNHKVTHFDCRDCDMDTDEEFEADIIVRRNNFETQHLYLGDENQTEESIIEFLAGMRHPILTKIEYEMSKREECIRNRPSEKSTESVVSEEHEEEQEEEFDFWAMFGVRKSAPRPEETARESHIQSHAQSRAPSRTTQETFVYNPNEFTLEEFREHLYMPGPENRYFYFQKQKQIRE